MTRPTTRQPPTAATTIQRPVPSPPVELRELEAVYEDSLTASTLLLAVSAGVDVPVSALAVVEPPGAMSSPPGSLDAAPDEG